MKKWTKIERLSLLTGCALGYGTLRERQLCIQHSIKQEAYLLWKSKLLNKAFNTYCTVSYFLDNPYPYCRLYFNSEKVRKLYPKVYINGIKTVTKGLLNQLTPLGLAIWYLDDGCLVIHKYPNGVIKSREVYWSTECFSYEEHILIQKYLMLRYGISTKLKKYNDRGYYRITMNATNANKFFDIIRKYVPESMNYKIDMLYKG